MALQRTTEGKSSSTHSMTREQAQPFAIRSLRDTFLSYPLHEQARIKAEVIAKLRDELRTHEFAAQTEKGGKRPGSALWQLAGPVYGITERDLELVV
jgi:hypothetical protein